MTELLAQMRMEWRLQWSRAFVWFCLCISFVLAAAATIENGYGVRGFSWVNGGDAIATRAMMLSVLGILVAAGVMGEALSRDREASTEEIVLATGVGRASYGLGRFLVAFAVILLIGTMFIPGMIIGAMLPGIPDERIGPFVPGHYLKALLIYIVPNLLLVSSLIYAVAARWRSQTVAFVAALGLVALYATMLMMLGQDAYRHDVFGLYALLDPYATIASAEYAMTWTVTQNNTQFRPLAGSLLVNRAVWLGVSAGLIILGTLGINRFLQQPEQKSRREAGGMAADRQFTTTDNEFLLVLGWELKALWRQPGVLMLLGFAAFSLWWAAASAVTYSFSLPTTDLLIHNAGFYFDKILVLLLVWYAGDIIWRERQYRVDEIIDVTPASDLWRLAAKTLALLLIVQLFWVISIAVSVVYQIAHGFYDFDWWLYLTDTFLFKAPYYNWLAMLAISMQVVVRQRYVAMALVFIVYLSGPMFDALRLYHPIYRFGETGFFWYSLVDGYGHFWRGHMWLVVYWSLAAVLIWLVAWGCYARGTEPPARRALWRARLLHGPGRNVAAVLLAGLVLTGGAIVWQSMIQHRWPLFSTGDYMAHVEKTYRKEWGGSPQPKIVGITAAIDLYPDRRRVDMQGTLRLQNQSDTQIDKVIVFFHPLLKLAELGLDAIAVPDLEGSNQHVQIWRLKQPLAPGAEMDMPFRTASYPDPGFALHNRHDLLPEVQPIEVIGNGTSIMNLNLMPAPGYSERLEHKPAWLRRQLGLPPEWAPLPSTLGNQVAHDTTHLGWVRSMDVILTTSADQIPLHAGAMVEDFGVVDGRRRIRYRVDNPSRGWSEIMSARYEVHREEREGLPPVELYHHPAHDYTLEPMAAALLDAMAHFRSRYGAAPFDTFRLAESAIHNDTFGQRGGLAYMSEILGWKTDLRRSRGEDLREYAANLMGLAWWSDQIIPANLPGAKSLWSGLPYWSAALYLHTSRGPELSREQRLQKMMESYRERAALEDEEYPFIEDMKSSTMIRNKGALHIVYLAELVGPERLEAAFSSFMEKWRHQPAPYPSAKDLLEHLKAELPSETAPQLDDFFRYVANWHLRVISARAWPDDSGNWTLRAVVDVGKRHSTGLGVEEEAPLETPLPLVVFGGPGYGAEDVLIEEWRVLDSGQSEITMNLTQKPVRFGVDPYLYLPDANPYDNVAEVESMTAP